MRAGLLVHPRAGIAHFEHHLRPGRQARVVHLPDRDGQRPARGHGVPRVDHQVQHDLLELTGVGHDPAAIRRRPHHQGDVHPEQPGEHLLHLADQRIETDDLGRDDLRPAEREQLPRQRRGAFAGAADLRQLGVHRVAHRQRMHAHVGRGVDDGQQVVEVVRDAAGQPADAVHLLRVLELDLQLGVLGDVHVRAEQADGRAGLIAQPRGAREDVAIRPVPVAEPELHFVARRRAVDECLHGVQHARAVLGMQPITPLGGRVGELGCLVTDLPLPLGRVVDDIGAQIPVPQADRAGLDRLPQPGLGLAKLALGLLPLADLQFEVRVRLLERAGMHRAALQHAHHHRRGGQGDGPDHDAPEVGVGIREQVAGVGERERQVAPGDDGAGEARRQAALEAGVDHGDHQQRGRIGQAERRARRRLENGHERQRDPGAPEPEHASRSCGSGHFTTYICHTSRHHLGSEPPRSSPRSPVRR